MALCEKILIVGFSGAGKTSLIRALKASVPEHWDHFDDLDQVILKARGQGFNSLSQLIDAKGWETFRLWERQELEGWLKQPGPGVLALGGGALTPLVWEIFGQNKKIKFCHLNVSFETAWQRVTGDSEIRPLVQLGKLKLQELYEERKALFNQVRWQLNGHQSLQVLAAEFWKDVTL
ncbi:MAG: hypothetical protein H0V66_02325 [Bdellovibrionales bacterium]|nr:hypothetical protein [Bdellovibrionales bacterium]